MPPSYDLLAPDLLLLSGPAFADVLQQLEHNMIDFRELVERCHAQPAAPWDFAAIRDEAKRLLHVVAIVKDALTLSYCRFTDVEIVRIEDVMGRVKGRAVDVSVLLRWLEDVVAIYG